MVDDKEDFRDWLASGPTATIERVYTDLVNALLDAWEDGQKVTPDELMDEYLAENTDLVDKWRQDRSWID